MSPSPTPHPLLRRLARQFRQVQAEELRRIADGLEVPVANRDDDSVSLADNTRLDGRIKPDTELADLGVAQLYRIGQPLDTVEVPQGFLAVCRRGDAQQAVFDLGPQLRTELGGHTPGIVGNRV